MQCVQPNALHAAGQLQDMAAHNGMLVQTAAWHFGPESHTGCGRPHRWQGCAPKAPSGLSPDAAASSPIKAFPGASRTPLLILSKTLPARASSLFHHVCIIMHALRQGKRPFSRMGSSGCRYRLSGYMRQQS